MNIHFTLFSFGDRMNLLELTREQILQAYKQVTCGCYVIDSAHRLLVCHPTGHPHDKWSIPKGLPNKNEDFYDAAIRELREETGLNIDAYTYEMYQMGVVGYENKPKALVGFAFFLDGIITKELYCTSTFRGAHGPIPEVDLHQWVDIVDAMDFIQPEQTMLFKKFTF